MGGNKITYNIVTLKLTAIFMAALLVWLTVSLPFISASKDKLLGKTEKSQSLASGAEEESSNPSNDTTEEKASGGNSFIEYFLHHHSTVDHFSTTPKKDYANRHWNIYIAFHGELIVPPPD